MAATIAYNLITFQLDGETEQPHIILQGCTITRRGGLEPDVWQATVAASDLPESIVDVNVEIFGTVKLWYSLAPTIGEAADVTLGNVAIVDLQPDLIGRQPGDSADSVLTYRIAIADHRRAFVEPRGGRLFDGLLNREPLPSGDTLYTNQQLMQACGTAMGVTLTVGTDANDADPMREVDFSGVHAPSALQELLEHTGLVYAPLIAGAAQAAKPGVGSAPSVPAGRLIRTVTAKSVDRRPSSLVLTSAPTAKVHTFNADAEEPAAWQYVVQDPADDQWKPLADVACLNTGTTPLEVWQKQFANLGAADQARMREQLYCCIQLDPDAYPPGKVRLLPQWIDTDLAKAVPFIGPTDTLVVKKADGVFAEANDEQMLLARQVVSEANVLIFPHPLMELVTAGAQPTHLNGANATPFPEAELAPTFSVEAWNADDDRREYGLFGFSVAGAGVDSMTAAAADDLLTGYRPNVCIYNQPELLEVIVNPEDGTPTTNRAAMNDRAETFARQLVRIDSLAVQTMTIKGFLAVEITGAVSEVSYDPQSVTTTVILNGWCLPGRSGGDRRGGGDADAGGIARGTTKQRSRGRRHARERVARQASLLGTNGTAKLVEPSRPAVQNVTWPRLYLVTGATPITDMKGRYNGSFVSVSIGNSASGDLALAHIGAAGDACEIWHPADINEDEPTLQSTDLMLAIEGPRHATRDKVIMITVGAPGGTGSLPVPTADYQVLTAVPDGSGGWNIVWDYPRIWGGT